ncbi:cytochrome b6-f complex iron-sulfur subunit 2, chloroplastic-like [Wolffia australiana]
MAATVICTSALPSQLASARNGGFCSPSRGLLCKPAKRIVIGRERRGKVMAMETGIPPVMGKRQLMNLLLLGSISLPSAGMLVPYSTFAAPSGSPAKDDSGNDISASEWLKDHGPNDRTLTEGLKGDPTYLIVENDRTLATYGLNAVCTHMGCIVPWNEDEELFMCPCHGSQYDNDGSVVRGPAPLPLALVHADIDNDKVIFRPWVETDFRTGEAPWWV